VDSAASPESAVTASPSFSVKDAAAALDALLLRSCSPRERDRPCKVPDGDGNSGGRLVLVLSEVPDDRSRPTTRSSRDKEFSTAWERDESELRRRGTPFSFRWRFHS